MKTPQTILLRDFLLAHPNEWLPMPRLAQVITETGIGAAVHSRVNDCRQKFEMQIENRLTKSDDGRTVSEYCYTPEPHAKDAEAAKEAA